VEQFEVSKVQSGLQASWPAPCPNVPQVAPPRSPPSHSSPASISPLPQPVAAARKFAIQPAVSLMVR
jgi:hypothetical protein